MSDDRVQRRRRGVIIAFAVLLTTMSAAYTAYSAPIAGGLRAVDILRAAAFLMLAAIISIRSTTGFSLIGRNAVLDDELTRANRADAARAGFWALMIASVAGFIASYFVTLTLAEASPLLIAVGAGAAALRFARLEGRDG